MSNDVNNELLILINRSLFTLCDSKNNNKNLPLDITWGLCYIKMQRRIPAFRKE